MYVSVAVNRPLFQLFSYQVPQELESLIVPGVRVTVPFGRQSLVGFVIKCSSQCDFDQPKHVKKVLDSVPVIQDELMDLALWMSQYYCTPLGVILFAMVPPDLKKAEDWYADDTLRLAMSREQVNEWMARHSRKKKPQQVLRFFLEQTLWTLTKLKEVCSVNGLPSEVKMLLKEGVLKIENFAGSILEAEHPLNQEQQKAYEQVDLQAYGAYLLYGVTGSGKTEVYLQLIEDVLKQGKSALVLVPEIALTPQLFARFEKRFPGAVALLHSQLSTAQRVQMWWKVQRGECRIAIGSRSAVFAPMKKLGLVVVDEEHESTYKQEESPRYHARDVAVMRVMKNHVPIVLGSATPSFESFYNVEKDKYTLLTMRQRAGQGQVPTTFLIDMRYDPKKTFLLSRLLFEKVIQCLQRQEQMILFLNRRGAIPALLCESCGDHQMCPGCEVALTYHASCDQLRCHYCDFRTNVEWMCSQCQSPLKSVGVGTQKLEDEVKRLFPQARVARLDTDTANQKGAMDQILYDLEQGQIDILVGTQMVAKGLDVHNVTLIGVVYADTGLFMPDFRSSERSFQLIHQVAGRAGRGHKPGEVVIQTYNPDHRALKCALKGDYDTFYQQEMKERKLLSYAPYARLVEVLLRGAHEQDVRRISLQLAQTLKAEMARSHGVTLLGPSPMPIAKINHQYRWHLLIKSTRRDVLQRLLHKVSTFPLKKSKVKVWINVDPIMMI